MPPPLEFGRKSVQKNWLDADEDFFFWSSSKFGQKKGLILSEDLCFGLHYSQISWPPLSKILRTLVRTSTYIYNQLKV